MKENRLSEILRETRYALRLNQKDMASTLGMGEKMYQLYESGKYDDVGSGSIKRQKLIDKIELVKNKIIIRRGEGKAIPHNDFAYQELEKKYQEAQLLILELQQRVIALQEHILKKSQKTLAHAAIPKKN